MELKVFQENVKKLQESELDGEAVYAYIDKTLENNLELFCKVMLPHLFYHSFGEIHRELFRLLMSDDLHAVVAYPRKHGKTTCLKGFLLWSIAYHKYNYIIWIGGTFSDIQRHYINIKKELENNSLFRAVYGNLEKGSIKWNESELYLNNGFHLVIKSGGQSLRGALDDNPPDLLLIDDLDDDEGIINKSNRDKLSSWLHNNALPALDTMKGKSRTIGTILDEDGQLSRMIQNPAWKSIIYSAVVDEGLPTEHALCESVFPLDKLHAKKEALFNAKPVPLIKTWWNEYMNQPSNIDSKKWNVDNLHETMWQGEYKNGYLIRHVGHQEIKMPCYTFEATDIAGMRGKNASDFTTSLAVAITADWHLWTLAIYKKHNSKPSETVKAIFDHHNLYDTKMVFMEEIGVADMIEEAYNKEAAKSSSRPMFDPIKSRGKVSKLDRITWALQDRLRLKQIHIREGHTDLIEQLKNPKGAHDDLLDNLADIATRGYPPIGLEMDVKDNSLPFELQSNTESYDDGPSDPIHKVFDF